MSLFLILICFDRNDEYLHSVGIIVDAGLIQRLLESEMK